MMSNRFKCVSIVVAMTCVLWLFPLTGVGEEQKPAPKPYPLTTCIVSDEPLDSMGGPVTIIHEDQEIKFCCGHCIRPFRQDPPKYLKKLENAPATQPAEPQ